MSTINAYASYDRALQWIRANTLDERGVVVTSRQRIPYPEVTGYLIPTLIAAEEFGLAEQYAEFLCTLQRPNGSFVGPDGEEYIFDSGQALRGLIAAARRWERFKPFAKKTADYILASQMEDGRLLSIYKDAIPEAVHVFVLPPLAEAAVMFGQSCYQEGARKSVDFYKRQPEVLNPKLLTHFLAYVIDGFIDMGETSFVRGVVNDVFARQKGNGSISAYPSVSWVCSTGLAQFAIIGYKLGMTQKADKAVAYLLGKQNPSGGFWGSYGYGGSYFPKEEISWANKFYLDALGCNGIHRQVGQSDQQPLNHDGWHTAMADHSVAELADKIRQNDFPVWIKPLLATTRPEETVLELGSGTGELAAILALYGRKVHLADYSPQSIAYAEQLFRKLKLSGEFYTTDIRKELPLKSRSVDWVMSSGVLEHFTDEEIVGILKKSKDVCTQGVISLVPNAQALLYRIGKHSQEKAGTWKYGKEIPKQTLRPLYEAAGLKNIREHSIGVYHTCRFWGEKFAEIKDFLDSLSPGELAGLNQGYLLFTSGERHD